MKYIDSEIVFKHSFFVAIKLCANKFKEINLTERGFIESIGDETIKRRFRTFLHIKSRATDQSKKELISFYSDRSAKGSPISRPRYLSVKNSMFKRNLNINVISRLDKLEATYRRNFHKIDRRTNEFKKLAIVNSKQNQENFAKFVNSYGLDKVTQLRDLDCFIDFVKMSVVHQSQTGELKTSIHNAIFIANFMQSNRVDFSKSAKLYSGMMSYLLECGQKAAFQQEDISSQIIFREHLSRISDNDADIFSKFAVYNADNLIERNMTRNSIMQPTSKSYSTFSYDAYLTLMEDRLRLNDTSNITPFIHHAIHIARGGAANHLLRRGGRLDFVPQNFHSMSIERSFIDQIEILSSDISTHDNMLRVYVMLGWAYENEGYVDKAWRYGLEAERLVRSQTKPNKEIQARILLLLGSLGIKDSNYRGLMLAERYFTEAKDLFESLQIDLQVKNITKFLKKL